MTHASARPDLGPRAFGLGLASCAAAVAAFLLVQLHAWPPHEDETLALFVARSSPGHVLEIVLGQRGGAPLHFLLAWVIAHTGAGLTGLRLISATFAVASVPVVGLLCARLADRRTALASTALACGTWALLFHGVYGRMYSLFLFTSALSYLALLRALDRGGRGAWLLWALAVVATVASHPYGALVLGSQALFVLLQRARLREAVVSFAAVLVVGIPFWRADLVLAGRFQVGVGGGGAKLGAPGSVLAYLRAVAGDLSAGFTAALVVVLALAALGFWRLARDRRRSAVLAAVVFGTPTLAMLLARLGSGTAPQTRHLIFALPLFSLLVAGGVVELARRVPRLGPALAVAAIAALVSTEVAWAWHKTPPLFTGEASARVAARHAASAWLARTGRRDDVLFGYEALFLEAWERAPGRISPTVIPRADGRLAAEALRRAPRPLGRAVWIFDASDVNNDVRRLTIPLRYPQPASEFEAHVWGPFLVIRTRGPIVTARRFLHDGAQVMEIGKSLNIGDADLNLHTLMVASARLGRAQAR